MAILTGVQNVRREWMTKVSLVQFNLRDINFKSKIDLQVLPLSRQPYICNLSCTLL